MNVVIKKVVVGLFFVLTILGFEQLALADSNNFSVTPVLTENQNPNVPSYFDLAVTPNQKQTIKIKIKNNYNEIMKYNIYVNAATTNQNGIIDYSVTDFEKDKSMKLSLKDCLIPKEKRVDIPANGEKEVSFDLSIPAPPFEGVVLGGITVEPDIAEGSNGVNNLFTRTIAVQLSETTKEISPKLKGGEVVVSQENLRNNIKFELRNITPTIISKVRANIIVTKKDSDTPIFKHTKEQLSFAPNSKFSLMTTWDKQFDSGEYVYNISLTDGKGNKWSFSKPFEIKAEVAEKLNKTSVDIKESFFTKYHTYLIALISILFIMGILFFLYRYLKKKIDKFFK